LTIDPATNRISGFTYDASGNLTVQPIPGFPSRNFTYDGNGCETSFSGPSGIATYTCDGNSVRVKKAVSGGTTTVYIFAGGTDITEYDNGSAVTSPSREFIYAGGKLVATLANNSGNVTTTYDHSDHRSIRLMTDGTPGNPTYGQMIGQQGTDAWGEAWYSGTATTTLVYTSYQRDQESGLDYAMARYYDSAFGRFCSADPVGGSVDDPQTWNRYIYVRDDPVNLMDPSGRKGFWGWLFQFITAMITLVFPAFAPAEIAHGTLFGLEVGDALYLDKLAASANTINFPQQQTTQSQPTNPHLGKVYCAPGVMDAMKAAWDAQSMANRLHPHSKEAGFPTYRNPGGYQAGNGPADKPPEIQTGDPTGFDIKSRTNATDFFHTHPPGSTGLPSTESNHAGEGEKGDTLSAVKSGRDIYVISDNGLSVAKPGDGPNPNYGKNSPWIVQGNGINDWMKKLKAMCGPQ
jgi:RHS repeat-associated protein